MGNANDMNLIESNKKFNHLKKMEKIVSNRTWTYCLEELYLSIRQWIRLQFLEEETVTESFQLLRFYFKSFQLACIDILWRAS